MLVAPTDDSAQRALAAEEQYARVLDLAKSKRLSPLKWYKMWHGAYQQALAHQLDTVKGTAASKRFLNAVAEQVAPRWAELELYDIIRRSVLGKTPLTLDQLGRILEAFLQENVSRATRGQPAIFARWDSQPRR
ncbi:hypothetical protein C8A00DRAFT_32755 [Chaetomidium leptoderma]|uniref:Uncharacterized protein n=1 Tax=Chaetomidium leptoderma TaxID=669021 RepID=A0AAN6VNM2_9PEZI|nr:hypothetical protein C8A00DRAFT_32755 [Chaetomidium leptoderma]